jgi:hypothetical protein
VDRTEILRVEKYLRSLFRLDTIRIEARPTKKDSVEVMVGDEFIGVIFKDTEDGDPRDGFAARGRRDEEALRRSACVRTERFHKAHDAGLDRLPLREMRAFELVGEADVVA